MGQSLTQIYVHAVTGTKFRKPLIHLDVEKELHAYVSGILKNLGCPALAINSMPDHIHLLFVLSKNENIAHVMREVKRTSSKWMKERGVSNFTWQGGYAAFSVDYRGVDPVKRYIQNQKEHHAKKSYKKEVEKLVEAYELNQYEEEFFWRD